jgi:YVTN family beta-propeller protein
VVNQGSQTLSFVDPATMTVRKSIPMSPAPHEITGSADGRTAFVSLYGNREVVGDSIAVIDVASQSESRRFRIEGHVRPHGLAFRDGRLYVTAEKESALLRLDPSSGKVEWSGETKGTGSHMLALMPDGKRIYCGNIGSNDVSLIEISGSNSVATTKIAVGRGPEGIALTPDGSELWAAHRGEGGVSVIDTKTNSVVATLLPEVVSARVAFTPDGRKVLLFDFKSNSVVVVDRATRNEIGRVVLDGPPGGGIVAHDSRIAYVSVYEPFKVSRVDLESFSVTGNVETGIAPDGMVLIKHNGTTR